MSDLIAIVSSNNESSQYNPALEITGTERRTSREKLHQDLVFELLQQRLWYRKFCCLFKIINSQSPSYLFGLYASPNTRYFARNSENTTQLRTKHHFYRNSFSPQLWKSLTIWIQKSENIEALVFSKLTF